MLRIQRRFNFTGRIDFDSSLVSLRTSSENDGTTIAHIDRVELPPRGQHDADTWANADVVLEAVRMSTTSYCRIPVGTVGEVVAGNFKREIELPDFDGELGILFRLKVVARDDKRLLAAADRIHAAGDLPPPDKDELIIVWVEDLGELPWRIDWDDVEQLGPIVKVNSKLKDPNDYLTRDSALIGAIVPQVFREVLYRICLEPHLHEFDWCKHWIQAARRLHDEPLPSEEDMSDIMQAADLWVREVVMKFADAYSMTSATNEFFGGVNE